MFNVIREMSRFRKMKDADLRLVLRYGTFTSYRKQKTLCYQSDPAKSVLLLLSGKVTRLKYRSDESCIVLGNGEAGDWVGLAEVLLECPYLNDTISDIRTEALAFTARAFDEVLKIKGMREIVLEYLAKSVYQLHSQIELNIPLPKLIRFIMNYAHTNEDGSCTLAITQDELAESIGVTRETVNRYLQTLQNEGLLRIGRGHIEVPDKKALGERIEF